MVRPTVRLPVRPGTSAFPDTLATSPDAVRKPASEKTPRAREGVRAGTVAYQAVVYSPVGNRSTCQVRGKGGAAGPSRRHRPAQVRVPENGPARSWTARRTSSIGTLAAGGIGNQSLQMRAEWGLEAGAVAEVAEGAAEGV